MSDGQSNTTKKRGRHYKYVVRLRFFRKTKWMSSTNVLSSNKKSLTLIFLTSEALIAEISFDAEILNAKTSALIKGLVESYAYLFIIPTENLTIKNMERWKGIKKK